MAKPDEPTEAQKRRIREKLASGTLPRGDIGGFSSVPPGETIPLLNQPSRVAPCDAYDEVGSTRLFGGWSGTTAALFSGRPRRPGRLDSDMTESHTRVTWQAEDGDQASADRTGADPGRPREGGEGDAAICREA
jgi:hypothetical protein